MFEVHLSRKAQKFLRNSKRELQERIMLKEKIILIAKISKRSEAYK